MTDAIWRPAAPTNYRAATRAPGDVELVVVHVTQSDDAEAALSWFKNPAARVSAHYTVDTDGLIYQSVREHDVAYAAPNANRSGIHIEHAGRVDKTVFPDVQLEASAQLVRDICRRWSIPVTRAHLRGHSEIPGNDHTDPGSLWPWARYIELVAGQPPTPLWSHPDGISVSRGTNLYGIDWPTHSHHGYVLAEGRWQLWHGQANPGAAKLKLSLTQRGKRRLTAVAYSADSKELARDDLAIVVA
jgi:hypothetical protein